jgi:type IV pilus assembly protein PilC
MAEVIAGKQFPFLWEGKDKKGNKIKGRGLAKSELEMRADLRRQGIAATKVKKERISSRARARSRRKTSRSSPASSPPC